MISKGLTNNNFRPYSQDYNTTLNPYKTTHSSLKNKKYYNYFTSINSTCNNIDKKNNNKKSTLND
jgi:hypothetical protein